MANTPSLVQVPLVTGTVQASIDNNQVVTSAGTVQRQVVTPGDPSTPGNYQAFDNNGNGQNKIGPGLTPLLTSAPINFSSSGSNPLINGSSGKIIRLYRIWFLVDGPTDIEFLDGSTPLSGAATLLTGGGITLDHSGEPWYVSSIGNALNLNSSEAVQVSGTVYYVQQ